MLDCDPEEDLIKEGGLGVEAASEVLDRLAMIATQV